MNNVIGFDIATRTGFTILGFDGNVIDSGDAVFVSLKDPMAKLLRLESWVDELLMEHTPELVIIENYGFGNKFTLVPLVEMGTIVRRLLHLRKIPMLLVPPTSLKKFATGKGNSKKDAIMLAVYKRWGHEAGTSDEADAFVLAQMGLAHLGKASHLTKANAALLTNL